MFFLLQGSAELKCDKSSKKGKIFFLFLKSDMTCYKFLNLKLVLEYSEKKCTFKEICAQEHPLLMSGGMAGYRPKHPADPGSRSALVLTSLQNDF